MSNFEAGINEENEFDQIPEDHRSGFVAVMGRLNVGKSTLICRNIATPTRDMMRLKVTAP